ncbi:MAG: hypothetical protein AABZ33_13920 [Chloroflexota bacterium]
MPEDLSALVAQLRAAGGDRTSVEVKSAGGGLPQSLTETLSALANQPGGGLIILGLDEMRGFSPIVDDNQPDRSTLVHERGLSGSIRGTRTGDLPVPRAR